MLDGKDEVYYKGASNDSVVHMTKREAMVREGDSVAEESNVVTERIVAAGGES